MVWIWISIWLFEYLIFFLIWTTAEENEDVQVKKKQQQRQFTSISIINKSHVTHQSTSLVFFPLCVCVCVCGWPLCLHLSSGGRVCIRHHPVWDYCEDTGRPRHPATHRGTGNTNFHHSTSAVPPVSVITYSSHTNTHCTSHPRAWNNATKSSFRMTPCRVWAAAFPPECHISIFAALMSSVSVSESPQTHLSVAQASGGLDDSCLLITANVLLPSCRQSFWKSTC